MAVVAPPQDPPGAAIDAQIAVLQALVTANANPFVLYQRQQDLNAAQVQAVNHYMSTGWLNASAILMVYSPPSGDVTGQKILQRVAHLQAVYNNALASAMPPGNANGYGDSGWTTLAASFAQLLYAEQTVLVQHMMQFSTTAAVMLANLTGNQTAPGGIPFQYVFDSVGFTDAWIDD